MATYIGKAPVNGFHTKQTLSSDGSTTTFTLDTTVATESSIIVSVGGIIQEPGVAYNLAQGGTKITFTGAPAATDTVYIQYLGQSISQTITDLNGSSLILDDDQDTTIGAGTDDQILFTVGGTANATYKTTGVHNPDSIKFVAGTGDDMQMYHDGSNSYLTNSTGALKLATETSGIAITIGHTTSEVTVADNLTVGGDLTVTGTTSFNDTNITNVGSIALDTITNDGTNITLDSSGDIILDADGGDVFFKDATTTIATFSNTSSDFVITTGVQDKDFIVKGDDGGSAITALTIDMSEAGAATFNNKIVATELDISGNVDIDGTTNLDAVDIDGAVQIDAALTVGVNDTGYDVKFFGDTASAFMLWDTSTDDLVLSGAAGLTLPESKLTIGSTLVTATAAELNKLDGVNSTTAELNIVDGGTSATSTTVADADRVVFNDGGTMVQVAVTDLAAYFDDEITAMPNLVASGALNSGSITSGFGNIDIGSSTFDTTGAATAGAITIDDVAINGKVITMTGSSSDTAVMTVDTNGAFSLVTTDDNAAAANIQITADGTAELAGTTVTLDSSGGITLDADGGTITFADAGSSLGTITSSGYSGTAAAATTVTITDNESTDENNVLVFVAGADSDGGTGLGLESDGNLTYNPSTGTLTTTNIVVSGTQTITNSVTMNANNAVVFEGSTADANETTLTSIDATGDRTISLPNVSGTLPVLAAVSATAITSTPAELNLLDGSAAETIVNSKGVIYGSGGAIKVSTLSGASDVTIDAAGDIILDADGADLLFKDAGTTIATFTNSSSDFQITTGVQDKDFVIKGNDGGSTITPFTLDMSAGGDLFLTGGLIDLKNDGSAVSQIKFYCESSNAHAQTLIGAPHSEGATNVLTLPGTGGDARLVSTASTATLTNKTLTSPVITEIDSGSTITLDATTDIILDADGGDIFLKDGGTTFGEFTNSSTDFVIKSTTSDKDMIFKGNDGGSAITALTLDMSAAGAATFNNDVTAFSDARLKENVETIDNALDKVCAMRGVTFNRIDNENGGRQMGVIAQEVQEIVPEVVKVNDDEDNTLSVSYGNLVGVLIESIKELKAEINELKGER